MENEEGEGQRAGEEAWFDLGCNCDNDKRPVEISYGDQNTNT